MKIMNKIRYALALLLVAGGSSLVSANCSGITAVDKSTTCCAATATSKCSNDTDVVIIGAGWAGLAAAMEFAKYNAATAASEIKYCVIEANSFTGGRAAAAHWVSGGEGNPLADMLWTIGNLRNVRYFTQKWSDIQYYDISGRKKIASNLVRTSITDFAKIYECAQAEAIKFQTGDLSNFNNDQGMRKVLNYCKSQGGVSWQTNGTKGTLQSFLEWYDLDYEFGRTPENISMWGYPLGPSLLFQDKDWFVAHPDNGAIIARAAANELGVCDKIQTSTEVCLVKDWNIFTNGNTVEVYTRPAQSSGPGSSACVTTTSTLLKTKKVIVTVSEGVLDQRGDNTYGLSMFDPPLGTIRTIRSLYEMIDYMEIFFKFNEITWNKLIAAGIETFQFTVVETMERGKCTVLQTYQTRWRDEFFGRTDAYPKGSRVLVCVLTTDTIKNLGTNRDELAGDTPKAIGIVNTLIKNSLGKVVLSLPSCTRRAPPVGGEDIIYKDPHGACEYWTFRDNPWWKGSYENFKLQEAKNATSEFFYATQANEGSYNNSNLHLAGSATCLNLWGYMPGAYYSGIREANKVIKALRGTNFPLGFTPTPQMCEAARFGGQGNIRPAKSS